MYMGIYMGIYITHNYKPTPTAFNKRSDTGA